MKIVNNILDKVGIDKILHFLGGGLISSLIIIFGTALNISQIISFLIGFIIVYGMLKALKNTNYFNMLAQMGLLTQFGLQALINIASTLHLIPTKGMTLPFISYGGSSMLSTSVTIGMILALSKRTTVDFSNNRGS